MLAALVVVIVSLIADAPRIAALAAIASIAMTLWFAMRRLKTTSRTPAHIAEMLWTSAIIPYLSIYWRIRGAFKFRVFFP
jgi:hypothetical protein